MTDYQDRWSSAGADGLRIRGYYFPWGSRPHSRSTWDGRRGPSSPRTIPTRFESALREHADLPAGPDRRSPFR